MLAAAGSGTLWRMELPLCCCGPEMVLCDVLLSSGAPGLDGCVENGFRVTLRVLAACAQLLQDPREGVRCGSMWDVKHQSWVQPPLPFGVPDQGGGCRSRQCLSAGFGGSSSPESRFG